ncbi:S9 family peptidase [Oscillatoria sp. CS-180]|uniref:S9 family peptidase n=1 Tax=Oscillatoria sp. CS-180 TaxID=3021720 RepID=UPI00232BD070|nr:S9 family peptidase [Oscillatoria sp. CS-180]MDB9525169.1 S9 family peptidase [Oscillatoria sp. CS-180]
MLKPKFLFLALAFALMFAAMPTFQSNVLANSPMLTPGDNLVTQNIPPIPMSLVEQVDRYTQFRTASLQSWHPTRQEMLISTRFGDTSQVHRVSQPLGVRYQLTFFPERVSNVSYQPTEGDYFIFSKDIGGTEANQTYRYDFATGDVTLLTDGSSRNSGGVWSTAGDRLIYTSNRRNGKDSDLYIMNPREPESDRLLAEVEGGGWFPTDWSPDDSQIAVIQYISITETYVWLFDAETGDRTRITELNGDEAVSYLEALFSPDGQGLYVVSDLDSEFLQLCYLELTTGELTVLSGDIPWNIEAVVLSPEGTQIAFVANENGASVLHLVDAATGQSLPLPELPLGMIRGLEWHPQGHSLGFTLMSARSTADVFSLNVDSGELQRWTQSETAGLNTETFSEPELVSWQSFDGRTITGFLYRPPAKFTGKRPVAMYIHGGPESQFRPAYLGRLNYYLNELGIALLFPNVRGSTGYGKTFVKLDNGYQREDAVKDIGALFDWIAAQPDLDSDRVLVTGASYGGYMSLAVATQYSDRIRASINVVGISNFVTFLENTEDYRRDLRRVEYGDERDPEMRQFLIDISPLTHADKIQKPMLVVHGANDPRVPLSEAEQLVEILEDEDVPVWYLVASDEGHGFSKKQNIDFQFYTNILFMKEFLLQSAFP